MSERVRIRLFRRRFLWLRKEIDLGGSFTLLGSNGYPALTLAPGEPWQVGIVPRGKSVSIPRIPQDRLALTVEVVEAHRKKPYRHPAAKEFIQRIEQLQSKDTFDGWD